MQFAQVSGAMSWLRKRRPNLDVRAASPRRLVRRPTPLTGEPPPATIRVADVHDGKTLDCFVSHCIYQGIVEAGRPLLRTSLRVGSFCAGSENFGVAMGALSFELEMQKLGVSLQMVAICEVVPEKRKWCMAVQDVLHGARSAATCAVDDITLEADGRGANGMDNVASCKKEALIAWCAASVHTT